MFSIKLLTNQASSLMICDIFSSKYIRQFHARFVFLFKKLSTKLLKFCFVHLKHDILNYYHTNDDELMNVIINAINDKLRTLLNIIISICEYCCYMKNTINLTIVD